MAKAPSNDASQAGERTPVLAYLRVSTDEQGRSGLGLGDQREAIQRAADYKGWQVVEWIEDTASGKDDKRPGYQRALQLLEDGGPDVLVVAKLDRLTRSMKDFTGLLERTREHGWKLVALDMDVDMTTANGEMFAYMLVNIAQWERRIIGERTKAALAQARENGITPGPKHEVIPEDVVARILVERDKGYSLQRIADGLNGDYGQDPVPTVRGKQWWPSTVSYVLKSRDGG